MSSTLHFPCDCYREQRQTQLFSDCSVTYSGLSSQHRPVPRCGIPSRLLLIRNPFRPSRAAPTCHVDTTRESSLHGGASPQGTRGETGTCPRTGPGRLMRAACASGKPALNVAFPSANGTIFRRVAPGLVHTVSLCPVVPVFMTRYHMAKLCVAGVEVTHDTQCEPSSRLNKSQCLLSGPQTLVHRTSPLTASRLLNELGRKSRTMRRGVGGVTGECQRTQPLTTPGTVPWNNFAFSACKLCNVCSGNPGAS